MLIKSNFIMGSLRRCRLVSPGFLHITKEPTLTKLKLNRHLAATASRRNSKCILSVVSSFSQSAEDLSFETCCNQKQDSGKSDNKRLKDVALGIAVGTTVFISAILTFFKNDKWSLQCNFQFPLSSVSAAAMGNPIPQSAKGYNFIADAVEKTANGVVFIELKERVPFFGKQVTVSNGSGFVVRSDGLILTNAHVVAHKSQVSVQMQDGRKLDGTVVAVDQVSDLAAVKVNGTNLPVLKLGRSSLVRAGEWVVALGSPLALSNSVTAGIVSSVARHSKDLGLKNKNIDYIQTDASITFGNSGGPLVNLNGEVIGINTMKVTAGISFAIPSDYASSFLFKVEEILAKGKGKPPAQRQWFSQGSSVDRKRFIGITMLTLTPELINDLKTRIPDFPDITGGVLVHRIVVGSPAFSAGLRAGDIITHINKTPIQGAADVYNMVESAKILYVTARRGIQTQNFAVVPETIL